MSTMIAAQNERNIAVEDGIRPALASEFTVGEWRVLPQLNRIRLNSNPQEVRQLEPRLVKLLCFLAANEDSVLSREELVNELWPRVVVNENSLTRAISELRKQLQSQLTSDLNYIETIPKRGYRLLPSVELEEARPAVSSAPERPHWMVQFTGYGPLAGAACLCLLIAGWVSFSASGSLNQGIERLGEPILLSDEVLDTKPDFLGGELQLSTLERSAAAIESIATPVMSQDEKQYAFIQYDTSGSTIFLGDLGTAMEPVPVYYSNQHLFNLAWSPLGNSLLFAKRPSLTAAAVYASSTETADLVTLNLNTLEASRLVKDLNPADSKSPNGLNLT